MVTESDKTATLTTMSNNVRLRLLFDDRNMLSKSKKKEGLKRCWFLLKPHLTTISDLASHILAVFRLHRHCPDGITLSMDGFVLPSFESTCILQDKDIVCVKRKGSMLTGGKPAMLPSQTHENQSIELPKLLAIEGFQEEREEYEGVSEDDDDDDSDQSEGVVYVESKPDGNATSKKRKASKKLKSPSKKKIKISTTENLADIPEVYDGENGSVKDSTHRKASLAKKDIGKSSTLSSQKNDKSGSTSEETRSLQPQDEGETKKLPSRSARRKKAKRKWLRELKLKEKEKEKENENEKEKLHPSQVLEKDDQQIPIKDNNCKVSDVRQQSNEESEADEDMVPVEIRPGHIRFQPRGKDIAAPENQLPVDTFQWNGTTSKKKGQKWGKERTSSHRQDDYEPSSQDGHAAQWSGTVSKKKDPKWGKERTSSHKQNDYEQSSQDGRAVQWSGTASKKDQKWGKKWTSSHKQDDHEQSSQDRPTVQWNGTISKDQKWGKEKTSAHKQDDHEQSSQDRPTVQLNGTTSKVQKWGKEKTSAHKQDECEQSSQDRPTDQNAGKKRTFDAVDFEKLTPYTDLPKEGNVIAYRLIELSESWTPELSSFRVGKTTQYDSKSNRIWLQPVSEFPFDFRKKIDDMDEDGSPSQSDPSPYQEDGSLEIDYASLADVRIIKHGHSDLATVVAHSDAFVTPTKATNNSTDGKPADNQTAAGSSKPQVEGHVTAKENGEVNVWDEINEALKAKKARLSQEDRWKKEGHSSENRSWSQRALRCSALGPTMALLRSQNGFKK